MKKCFECKNEFEKYKVDLDYITPTNNINSTYPVAPPSKISYITLSCPKCGIILSVDKQ